MSIFAPGNEADLWLMLVCLSLIVVGIGAVIYARRMESRVNRKYRHAYHVAKVRQQARNGF
jgi:hypothetical protein